MARYTSNLQERFNAINGVDGQSTTIIQPERSKPRDNSKLKLYGRLAIATALAGLFAGMVMPSNSNPNTSPKITSPNVSKDETESTVPQPDVTQPDTIFGPTDFSLEFSKYTTKDGCRSFGKVVVKDQVLTAQIGAQPFQIDIKSATTEFQTCTNDAKVTYTNGPLDKESNTYPEIVELDATSLGYGAILTDVEMSMKPIAPQDQLKAEGTDKLACKIYNVCDTKTEIYSQLPEEVTDVVLASAKAQIVMSAQDLFAPIEQKTMVLDTVNDLQKQAKDMGVNPNLVSFALVDKDGNPINTVANYGNPLFKTTLKNENAAITKKDLYGIFGTVTMDMQYIPNTDEDR